MGPGESDRAATERTILRAKAATPGDPGRVRARRHDGDSASPDRGRGRGGTGAGDLVGEASRSDPWRDHIREVRPRPRSPGGEYAGQCGRGEEAPDRRGHRPD